MVQSYIPSKSRRSYEPWSLIHTRYKRSVDQRPRTSGKRDIRSSAAKSGSGQLKHKETCRLIQTHAPLAATQVSNYTKGELVRRLIQVVRGKLISEDKKREAVSVLNEKKKHLQARRQQRRKHNAEERCNKSKRKSQCTALHRPPGGNTKAFQEAGFPSKSLWNLSHRNKAKGISQIELEPDKSKLILYDLRKGLV